MLLERHGLALSTVDVARAWLQLLPAGATWTAERAAYRTLLERGAELFAQGTPPGFDLAECARNEYSDWIGAQIRADMYGWVCPGRPALAADLARRDASLSHRGDGVEAAAFVAAFAGAIPASRGLGEALDAASRQIPRESGVSEAVSFGQSLVGVESAVEQLHERYAGLPPVHALNNLALVVWALLSHEGDYSAAIGEVVAAGWDTDCNGATVGGLWGLSRPPDTRAVDGAVAGARGGDVGRRRRAAPGRPRRPHGGRRRADRRRRVMLVAYAGRPWNVGSLLSSQTSALQ